MKQNRATISDIAQRANVSKATVSRVLNKRVKVNEEKKQAVLQAMDSLGFQPNSFARVLAGGRSMTVGILTQNIGTNVFDKMVNGIISGLSGSGYSPILADGLWETDVECSMIETLIERQIDGLIVVSGDVPPDQLARVKEQLPTVIVGRDLPDWGDQCIAVDNVKIGYQATRFLIESGHHQIAHLKGKASHPDAVDRDRGYRLALQEAGIEVDEELIVEGDFHGQSGLLAVESLMSQRKTFTAIFAANDQSAYGALLGLYRRGIRVPDNVSVIGVDDQYESRFTIPPLTTIQLPCAQMGIAAAGAIVKLINAQPYDVPQLLTRVEVRESVGLLR